MVRKGTGAALILCCCALLAAPAVLGASFTATVDRTQLYVNEPVLLTLALTNSDTRLRAQGLEPNVDLSVLTRDFELGIPRASHRYNIHRNRGRSTSEIKVLLFPRRAGDLRIPPFTVDGLSTAAITLRVLPPEPDPSPPVFARHGVEKNRLFVGERTVVYLDLYHRVALKSARLGGPLDTEPKRLHLSELPVVERTARVEGLEYKVSRTAWSITPVTAGRLEIYFPDIWIETRDGQRLRLPFADSVVEVVPLPEGVPPGTLVGHSRLDQSLPGDELRAGVPFTWVITLRAAADIQALPPALPVPAVPGLKIYFEPADKTWKSTAAGDPPLGVARYRAQVIPLQAGTLQLPAISLPYFDPQTRRLAETRLPASAIQVAAAPNTMTAPTALPPAAMTGIPDRERPAVTTNRWAVAAALFFAVLWLGTLVLWWRQRGKPARPEQDTETASPAVAAGHRPPLIKAVCEALGGDSLEVGLRRWEERQGRDEDLRRLIRELQACHYGRHRQAHPSPTLEQEVRRFLHKARSQRPAAGEIRDPWQPESFTANLNDLP